MPLRAYAHAPYCHQWPLRLYITFRHFLINGKIKKITEHKMCVEIFSTILSEIFILISRIQRDNITNVHSASCEVPFTLVTLL